MDVGSAFYSRFLTHHLRNFVATVLHFVHNTNQNFLFYKPCQEQLYLWPPKRRPNADSRPDTFQRSSELNL